MTGSEVRIGLVLGHSVSYCREILRGIRNFALERPEWLLTPIFPDSRAVQLAASLNCDGYIAHIFEQSLADALVSMNRPVVNVSGVLPELPFCRVASDHAEVGRQAARHLLERNLTELAFVGYPRHYFSIERQRGFSEVAREHGVRVSEFLDRSRNIEEPNGLWRWNNSLQSWIQKLPKPIGILASHDIQGVQLSEYCNQLHIRIPDDVAIVGVDNDDLLCELARPSLSSVALPSERIGFQTAKLLDSLLQSKHQNMESIILPPGGVVVRQSSDLQSIPDRDVADALRYIRSNSNRPIQVTDVLQAVPVSRRGLERRFRKSLNRSIFEEINRTHVERARQMLISTSHSMASIADKSGFRDSRHFSILFRKLMGVTPTAYRLRFGLKQ
jgi:LacI family transcriptional regulator